MYFENKEKGFICVEIEEEKIKKLENFVENIIKQKEEEKHHKIDGKNEYKRFYTGFLGEAALEEVLGIDLIDWSIGKSDEYNIADLHKIGLNVGVKTVESGKHHIIHSKPVRPEIIMFKDKNKNNRVIIMGVATVENMKKNQNRELILSPFLKARKEKTAFCGYKEVKPFKSLKELNGILKEAQ